MPADGEPAEADAPGPRPQGLTISLEVDGATWPDAVRNRIPEITGAIESAVSEQDRTAALATAMMATDTVVGRLNAQFRGKTGPTNVLSFPASGQGHEAPDAETEPYLGDIVLAKETVIREAEAMGLAVEDHATHLIVHGILHLFGYDHQSEADADTMETLEIEILEILGIANPYREESPSR